jgi:hypothetical protein
MAANWGSLGPTKGMDATPAPPLVARHVGRASDGGSRGMASAIPYIKLNRRFPEAMGGGLMRGD